MNRIIQYCAKMVGGGDVPDSPPLTAMLLAGMGGAIAIASVGGLTQVIGAELLMAPFGASCFLAFAMPQSPLAQPRNIVFGHVLSATAGLLVLHFIGTGWLPMALAVGLAIVLMQLTRTGHAPAGANPLVVMTVGAPWDFLVFPVLIGAAMVVLVAVIFNNFRRGIRYPVYW